MTKVKICGLTNLKDLETVSNSGADAIGVITGIPSSPRNVSLKVAKDLISNTTIFTKSVLVIAPKSLEETLEICEYVKPDAIQLHGENTNLRAFPMVIKNIDIIKPLNANISDIESTALKAAELFDAVLIDSSTNNKLGGTGKVHDWEISRKTAEAIKPKPLILAGGLHPGNVIEAINRVRPYAVDVCTGTESIPGVKDPKKINHFLSMVKKADRERTNLCANTEFMEVLK
jgi:phosphoribosylanthranilate isomerase